MFIVPPEWFERIFDIPQERGDDQEDQDAHQAELETCTASRTPSPTRAGTFGMNIFFLSGSIIKTQRRAKHA